MGKLPVSMLPGLVYRKSNTDAEERMHVEPSPDTDVNNGADARGPRPLYSPAHLLDRIEAVLQLNSDAELARVLEVAPPALQHIRQCLAPVRASLISRMADATGLSIAELRGVLGDRRREFRC